MCCQRRYNDDHKGAANGGTLTTRMSVANGSIRMTRMDAAKGGTTTTRMCAANGGIRTTIKVQPTVVQ